MSIKLVFKIPLILFCCLSSTSFAQGLLEELKVSAALDLLHPVSFEKGSSRDNRLDLRSAEFMFYAPIDHTFDGVLNFAGHSEEGEFIFEVHEAYVGSSKLIPRSRFRVGKFLLGVGRLNQHHQHDWPFVTAPKVQKEFFAEEAAADTGFEYSILLPTNAFLDLTFGVTNGYCYGHCHDLGDRPLVPLHYFRPATFFEFGSGKGLLLALNYLGRTDASSVKMSLVGLDMTFKERVGKTLKWLVQSELWHRSLDGPEGSISSAAGAYVYTQYGFDPIWSFGVRLDGYSVFNQRFPLSGEKQKNLDYAVVPTLNYRSSEFANFRLAYSHGIETAQGIADVKDRRLELQFVFLMGAHPAHEF